MFRFARAALAAVCGAGLMTAALAGDRSSGATPPKAAREFRLGAWGLAFPVDEDQDGDLDLFVRVQDQPHLGTFLLENLGGPEDAPVLAAPRRVSEMQLPFSRLMLALSPAIKEHFPEPAFWVPRCDRPEARVLTLPLAGRVPAADEFESDLGRRGGEDVFDRNEDGVVDRVLEFSLWPTRGWDVVDIRDSRHGWRWNRELIANAYVQINEGSPAAPRFGPPRLDVKNRDPFRLADGNGRNFAYPNAADFDGDGDVDVISGDFRAGVLWFENIARSAGLAFEEARCLRLADGSPLTLNDQQAALAACDWDDDGRTDLVGGVEDGRFVLIRNSGWRAADGRPVFEAPVYFRSTYGTGDFPPAEVVSGLEDRDIPARDASWLIASAPSSKDEEWTVER